MAGRQTRDRRRACQPGAPRFWDDRLDPTLESSEPTLFPCRLLDLRDGTRCGARTAEVSVLRSVRAGQWSAAISFRVRRATADNGYWRRETRWDNSTRQPVALGGPDGLRSGSDQRAGGRAGCGYD